MTLNTATITPRQETGEEQDIILDSFQNLSNKERLANITAEIDSIVRNRKEAERSAALNKIKELVQKYEINLSEISTESRNHQKRKEREVTSVRNTG